MHSTYDGYTAEASMAKAASAKRAMALQIATTGFYILGIFVILVGIAMAGCGIVNIVVGSADRTVTGFLPGIFKTISGIFTVINGLMLYKLSLKAMMKMKKLKVLFVTTCIALALHITTFVLAALSIFNLYINFGDNLLSTCNRDSNTFASVVANSGYSGAQLNPNYNPSCTSGNANCNIDAYPILNYNYNYWYSQMQNYILALYNNYKYVFRYAFAVDALHVLFSTELLGVEIGLLIIIGHIISHIEEDERIAEETVVAPDPTLIGSQMAIPHNRTATSQPNTQSVYSLNGSANATAAYNANPNEPIYVNIRAANRIGNGQPSPNGRPSPANKNSTWSIYGSGPQDGQTIYAYNGPQNTANADKF